MEDFIFKKIDKATILSAKMTDYTYKKHRHEEYCIGVTLKGIQECELDGHKMVSNASGVMLFNPEQAHTGNARDQDEMDYVMIYLPPSMLKESLAVTETPTFHDSVIYDPSIANHIYTAASAAVLSKEEIYHSNMASALDLLVRKGHFRQSLPELSADSQLRIIEHVRSRIASHIQEPLSLNVLAHDVGVSKYQLIRIFKRHIGMTPYQYQMNVRVEEAKHIIESTRDVYEAVAALNFTDLSHLNRLFKGVYGISCGKYLQGL